MNSDRWAEVKPLLDRILELPPEERQKFTEIHCGGDPQLRRELESFLRLEDEVEEMFKEPLLDIIAGRSPEYRAGQQIGPYRLDEEIDRGGMGVVYRATRVEGGLTQQVAIKILKRGFDTASFVRRFRTEQQILIDLDHPNIVQIFDGSATPDGLPYLVMEHVEGVRLDKYCADQKLDLNARLDLFAKICDAVHVAHQHMVVHCDLKPSNILVTPQGEPKLLDFGIAKVLHQGDDTLEHTLSQRLGTLPYASQEQTAGEAITTANDVYSLGCLLFLLLTGQPPKPQTSRQLAQQVPSRTLEAGAESATSAEAAKALVRKEEIQGDLDAITLMAMAWDPADRYVSVAALADDISRHRNQLPVAAQPYTWKYVASRFVRRRRKEVILVAAFAALLTAGIAAVAAVRINARLQATRATEMRDAYLEMLEVYDPTSAESKAEATKTAVDKILASERFFDPLDQAILYDRMGRLFYRLEYLPDARRLLEKALLLRRQESETDPGNLAASLNNLGLLLKTQGERQQAARLFDEAAALYQKNPGLDPSARLDLQVNRASLQEANGQFQSAEREFQDSLRRNQEVHGNDSPEVATIRNNYGMLLVKLGRLEEAEPMLREALRVRRTRLGADHPSVATVLINLAACLDRNGHSGPAIENYRQALKIRERAFATDNPLTARAQASLAYALSGRGDPDDLHEANQLLTEAHHTYLAKKGARDQSTLIIQRNLAAVLLQQGHAAEAEALIRPVVEIAESSNLPWTWRLADARSLLGGCLLAQDRLEEARPLLQGAADLIAKERGEESRPAREARGRWAEWVGRSNHSRVAAPGK